MTPICSYYNILNSVTINYSKIHGFGLYVTKNINKDTILFTAIKNVYVI